MKSTLFLALVGCATFLGLGARTKADPLKVGDSAPAVSGVTETGDSLNLADVYKKQEYTLVYFYPKADTPGCTKQGCSLRDGYEALTKKGVAVVGVSHDTPEAQKAFKEKYHLPFPLIADHDETVSKAFGVPNMMMHMAHRSAYLIKNDKIIYTDYKGTTSEQADTILKVVAAQGS